jgi:hypothetical protein
VSADTHLSGKTAPAVEADGAGADAPAPGEDLDRTGTVVVDVEGDTRDEDDRAIVINSPPKTADEWVLRRDGGEATTLADENPAYPEDDDVIVVAYESALREHHPGFDGYPALELAEVRCRTHAYPASRLRRVGELEREVGDIPPEERLTDGQRDLRDRLAERSEVGAAERDGEAVLVVEKLGEEHTIRPDGSVDGGPVADRLESLAADYLGGETA